MSDLRRRVGRRVAELRRGRGMTQQNLADAMGWSSLGYVARIEAGKENVGLDTLEQLAGNLSVDPSAFFEQPTTAKPGPGRPKRQR